MATDEIPWFDIVEDGIVFNAVLTRHGVPTIPVRIERIAKMAAKMLSLNIKEVGGDKSMITFTFDGLVEVEDDDYDRVRDKLIEHLQSRKRSRSFQVTSDNNVSDPGEE